MWRDGDCLYIAMELIPGQDLRNLWATLSENEKAGICAQLRQASTHIRAIPSTEAPFGNVSGGPLPHLLFGLWTKDPKIMSPFQTSEDLAAGLAAHVAIQKEDSTPEPWHYKWLTRNLPAAPKNFPSTFTHGDLMKQNIMVQEQPGVAGQTDRQFLLTGLIDWETAGWYPAYWEYANHFAYAFWEDVWEAKVESFLDPHPCAAAMMRIIKLEIEGF